MKKSRHFKIGSIALLITFIIGVSVWILQDKFEPTQLEIPNASWEKSFFKEIDNVTNLSDLQELRKTNLSKNDLEIRIWRGFGLSNLEGIVIIRTKGNWSAIHIKGDSYIEIKNTTVTKLRVPKSGWDSFWNKINETGILTLPDASQINCDASGFDGTSYVVEANHLKKYRTYRYYMSSLKCDEAKQLEKIGEIIAEEFDDGKGVCKRAEWIPCARLNRERNSKTP